MNYTEWSGSPLQDTPVGSTIDAATTYMMSMGHTIYTGGTFPGFQGVQIWGYRGRVQVYLHKGEELCIVYDPGAWSWFYCYKFIYMKETAVFIYRDTCTVTLPAEDL